MMIIYQIPLAMNYYIKYDLNLCAEKNRFQDTIGVIWDDNCRLNLWGSWFSL